jgi:hypothetical protein
MIKTLWRSLRPPFSLRRRVLWGLFCVFSGVVDIIFIFIEKSSKKGVYDKNFVFVEIEKGHKKSP